MSTWVDCQSPFRAMNDTCSSNETYLDAMTGLLNQIKSELHQNVTEYRGTESFKPSNIKSIFTDKTLKLVEGRRKGGWRRTVSLR